MALVALILPLMAQIPLQMALVALIPLLVLIQLEHEGLELISAPLQNLPGVFTPFSRTAPSLPFYHPHFTSTYERERERAHPLRHPCSSSSSDFDHLSTIGNLLPSTSAAVESPLSPLLLPLFTHTSHHLLHPCSSSSFDFVRLRRQGIFYRRHHHCSVVKPTRVTCYWCSRASPFAYRSSYPGLPPSLSLPGSRVHASADCAFVRQHIILVCDAMTVVTGYYVNDHLPTITLYPLQQTNSDLAKLIDKPFPYKQQMDILCGKTTVRSSHFLGSTQDVDVDSQRSFCDDDNSTRQGFSAMGLDSQQVQSIDDDNFNPFDFPPLSQPPSYENTQTQNTPIEDEATSPDERRTTQAQSSKSRKRRSKKYSELLTLAQYYQLNDQRMKLEKSLFPGSSSSTVSKDEEQYTVRECVSRLKTMVNGYPGARYKGFVTVEEGNMVFRGIIMRQTSSANDTVPFQAPSVVHETQPREAEERVVYRDAILEENAMFMAVGEMLMSFIMDEDEEDTTLIPRPMHTSRHTGHVWVHEVLHGHERRCYNTFRMHPSMFLKLRDILVERELIRDCRYVTTSE
ncbi:hypothetical protein Taro_049882 [Colocasia esculenta]|uniref:DUF8040 domain-containing protein n=1 Tax=Colocasia esculenta TaxID=4460 RepID=A0A843XCC6_COLES|nr:hypothetical protein [Colocasia esculenta]